MPTMNPRITFTVSEDMMSKIEEYRFSHRMKNQTQAVVSLINLGLQSVAGGTDELPTFTGEEVRLVEAYRGARAIYKEVVTEILLNHPDEVQESHT